jgi:hypothetical protein
LLKSVAASHQRGDEYCNWFYYSPTLEFKIGLSKKSLTSDCLEFLVISFLLFAVLYAPLHQTQIFWQRYEIQIALSKAHQLIQATMGVIAFF